MPDFTPARLDPSAALDELLPALFRRLQNEPAPEGLGELIDRLEQIHARAQVGGEARTLAQSAAAGR